MKMTLKEFSRWPSPLPVVIQSIDMVGYQARVTVDEQEYRLIATDGRPLRFPSLMQMREALSTMPVASITLRHQSAYDQMINQPVSESSNALEVTVAQELYPTP